MDRFLRDNKGKRFVHNFAFLSIINAEIPLGTAKIICRTYIMVNAINGYMPRFDFWNISYFFQLF